MAQGFPGAIASDRGSSRGNISGDSGPHRKAQGRFVLKLRTLLSLSLVLTPLWGLAPVADAMAQERSEEHTSELQSLMRLPYAVFCLKKNTTHNQHHTPQ